MEEEKKEEEKKEEQAEEKKEEEKQETEGIPGVEQAKEAIGMVQGITGKISSLVGSIFGGSKEEKKK